MYEPQRKLLEKILSERKVIVLKSRQTGITTVISQLVQWLLLFNISYKVGVISYKQEHQSGFIDRKLKVIFRYLPPFLMKPVETNNKTQIIFNDLNGDISWVMQEQTGPNSQPFTGETVNFLFIDEQQKIPYIEKHLQSMLPTMATTLSQSDEKQKERPVGVVIVSTPNGIDGVGRWFYETWEKNKKQYESNEQYDYFPFFIHWKDCGFTEEWYEHQKSLLNNNVRLIKQELDQEFLGSGDSYFNLDLLQKVRYITPKLIQINWTRRTNYGMEIQDYRTIKVWEEPQKNIPYVIGVDPQTEEGEDFTQIEVINGYNQVQQQEWSGHINVVDLQHFLYELQKYYNHQLLQIEKNYGYHLIERLMEDFNYRKIFRDGNKYGISVTKTNRKIIIQEIDNLLPEYDEENYNFIRSKDLLEEMYSFIFKTSSRQEQMTGRHDDLIFQFQYQIYARNNSFGKLIKTVGEDIEREKIGNSVRKEYQLEQLLKMSVERKTFH